MAAPQSAGPTPATSINPKYLSSLTCAGNIYFLKFYFTFSYKTRETESSRTNVFLVADRCSGLAQRIDHKKA